ncbi:MAG TPA: response regulator [Chloroflexi bacterium]|nr:response regulator [Chloroflexota bacterium]
MAETDKTILIVEDSPVQAMALEHMLREEGVDVLWASNGLEGVRLAQQHLPDAIVLDIEMPQMGGLEACRHLKKSPQTADMPIVLLTVRDDAATALTGIDLGAIDFIPKDAFSGSVLLETLRQLNILPGTGGIEGDVEDDHAEK